jgi:two-component system, chemotaxis family, chemotaxis protein CheV
MASVLDTVDSRTQLVGQNRFELLLFRLKGNQRFGINVFKVREVLPCPPLRGLPGMHEYVRGVAQVRDQTISIIDMNAAIGGELLEDLSERFVIITEYNRRTQGFLVEAVERIINMNWEDIMPPPKGAGSSYLTAVTEIDNELVEILDVEKVLHEIAPLSGELSEDVVNIIESSGVAKEHYKILLADDSKVALQQAKKSLEPLNLEVITATNGREALEYLLNQARECEGPLYQEIPLLISDVEMPEMDGYTLTSEIHRRQELNGIKVILHTSLSGVFNQAMVKKVGADGFIAKFSPDELVKAVSDMLQGSK